MSADAHDDPQDDARAGTPVGTVPDSFPEPAAHGGGFQVVLNDLLPSDAEKHPYKRDTLYSHVLETWRTDVGSRENEGSEGYELVPDFSADWIPDDGIRYAILLKSSRWKGGHGVGSNYTQFYDYDLVLRKVTTNQKTGETVYRNPPLSCHVKIVPQYHDLVYEDGNPIETPYGTGTRLTINTTWAETADDAYSRLWDVLTACFGADPVSPDDANPESKKLEKVEAHSRFDITKKNDVVDTVNDSESLIAYGGHAEITSKARRQKQGWLEAGFTSNRWEHLGFDNRPFETGIKLYQRGDWTKLPESNPAHHPKLEAFYDGVTSGPLPHADEYQDILDHLRAIVATHAHWAGVERADLIADDYQDGPAAPTFEYDRPEGRRDMLRQKYEKASTEIYREALKVQTRAVFDILAVVARENGATYDTLMEKTGLTRSAIRYHVARLEENDVLERLGNPVLVVYDSQSLLDDAREILKEAYPDDTPADREERAKENRERRENRDDPADPADPTDETSSSGDDSSTPNVWRYLDEWRGTPQMLLDEIVAGDRSERDVRVRVLPTDGANPPDRR